MDINEQIEKQIEEEKKSVDYDTRESITRHRIVMSDTVSSTG